MAKLYDIVTSSSEIGESFHNPRVKLNMLPSSWLEELFGRIMTNYWGTTTQWRGGDLYQIERYTGRVLNNLTSPPGETLYLLPSKWKQYLIGQPESGKGHQIASIHFEDDTVLHDVEITDASGFYSRERLDVGLIERIVVRVPEQLPLETQRSR